MGRLHGSLSETLTPFSLLFFFFSWFSGFTFAAFNLTTLSFDEGYSPLFGDGNLVRSPDGHSVRLLLDVYTGDEEYVSNHARPFVFIFVHGIDGVALGEIQGRVLFHPVCINMDFSVPKSSCHQIILLE